MPRVKERGGGRWGEGGTGGRECKGSRLAPESDDEGYGVRSCERGVWRWGGGHCTEVGGNGFCVYLSLVHESLFTNPVLMVNLMQLQAYRRSSSCI